MCCVVIVARCRISIGGSFSLQPRRDGFCRGAGGCEGDGACLLLGGGFGGVLL